MQARQRLSTHAYILAKEGHCRRTLFRSCMHVIQYSKNLKKCELRVTSSKMRSVSIQYGH